MFSAVTVTDLVSRHPQLVPTGLHAAPDAKLADSSADQEPFAAVLVMEDPLDWHAGLQVVLDVLQGDGRYDSPMADSQVVPIYFSNPGTFSPSSTNVFFLHTGNVLLTVYCCNCDESVM